MPTLATRLGVVPAALYRHVHSKEQLYDRILDGVPAGVDCQAVPALPRTGRVTALAHRLRTVLEDHPGIAALLKTRDPSASTPSHWPRSSSSRSVPPVCRPAALAFHLIYDYTLGFALSDRTSPGEQRVEDTATRAKLHAFLCSLPASRFPALTALGAYAWPTIATSGSPPASTPASPACGNPPPRTHDAALPPVHHAARQQARRRIRPDPHRKEPLDPGQDP
jgi:AcrR family transcriptional regulator